MPPLRIVLLGPPASGKGTQGSLLAERHQLSYFSTGRQLRLEWERGSALGKMAEPFLARGQYVPDELALALADDWIQNMSGGWVLDGFPRTLGQVENLDDLVPDGSTLCALLIDLPVRELQKRVADRVECLSCSWTGTRHGAEAVMRCPACGGEFGRRPDDHLENFQKRLAAFEELTLPVARHYDSSGRLHRVCGAGTPQEVFQRVQSLILSS